MLTRLTVRNFRRFEEEIERWAPLSSSCGSNDSGKTTALRALALWELGLRRWLEKRGGKPAPGKRPGVIISTGISSPCRCRTPSSSGELLVSVAFGGRQRSMAARARPTGGER